MVYKQLKINITKNQLDKALKGKPVQFSANQLGDGQVYLSLHPANAKIVEKAVMKGRGCILDLTEGELLATAEDMEGNGIFGDIWKGLKSGYKWAKKNVIDSDFYQKNLRPLAKQAVEMGKNAAKAYLNNPIANQLIDASSNELSKETGAFGVRKTKAQKKQILAGKGLYLS
jgi:hypothetical protein